MAAHIGRPRKLVAAGFLLVAGLTVLAYAHLAQVNDHGGWKEVWSSSFEGPAGHGIDRHYWRYQISKRIIGNGEDEVMTDSPKNVYLDGDGGLNITALHQGGEWTSGRIQTVHAFTPLAGGELRVIASLRQPDVASGRGYWPAFWMLGRGSWPAHGEIDIMEDVNGISEHSGALHCGNLRNINADGTFGPCHEHRGRGSGLQRCRGCQTGYHTYSVIIDRRNSADEQIRWYLDRREFFSVSEREVGTEAWNTAIDHGFTIIFDLAIGGPFPNGQCSCVTPMANTSSRGTLGIRDVAVYER